MTHDDVDHQMSAFFADAKDHHDQSAETDHPNFDDWDAVQQSLPKKGPIAIGLIEDPHPAKVRLAILALSRLGRGTSADLMDDREIQLYQQNGQPVQESRVTATNGIGMVTLPVSDITLQFTDLPPELSIFATQLTDFVSQLPNQDCQRLKLVGDRIV